MTLLIVVVFVTGLSFLLYPTVSNLWNHAHQSRAIATYTEQVEKLDDSSNKEMLKAARKYNKELLKKADHWKLSKKDKKKYKKRIISKTLTITLKPKHNATLYLAPPFLLSFIIYINSRFQKNNTNFQKNYRQYV